MQKSLLQKLSLLLSLIIISFTGALDAKPAQVILIRHGEKPPEGENLSVKGYERAAALVPFFLKTQNLLPFGSPVAIYATKANKQDKSNRTQQTVAPLAQELNLKVKADYIATEYALAANEIVDNPNFEGKTVLVCWEHHNIPPFIQELGVKAALPKWNGDVYDQLWIVTYKTDGKVEFSIQNQALLYGDTPQ